jgi:hypothetical protein
MATDRWTTSEIVFNRQTNKYCIEEVDHWATDCVTYQCIDESGESVPKFIRWLSDSEAEAHEAQVKAANERRYKDNIWHNLKSYEDSSTVELPESSATVKQLLEWHKAHIPAYRRARPRTKAGLWYEITSFANRHNTSVDKCREFLTVNPEFKRISTNPLTTV